MCTYHVAYILYARVDGSRTNGHHQSLKQTHGNGGRYAAATTTEGQLVWPMAACVLGGRPEEALALEADMREAMQHQQKQTQQQLQHQQITAGAALVLLHACRLKERQRQPSASDNIKCEVPTLLHRVMLQPKKKGASSDSAAIAAGGQDTAASSFDGASSALLYRVAVAACAEAGAVEEKGEKSRGDVGVLDVKLFLGLFRRAPDKSLTPPPAESDFRRGCKSSVRRVIHCLAEQRILIRLSSDGEAPGKKMRIRVPLSTRLSSRSFRSFVKIALISEFR